MPRAERPDFMRENENVSDELLKVHDWLNDTENSTPETMWSEAATEDYRFYAGDQDADEVIEMLEEQNRPASVYNEVKPKIDVLIGMASQTRSDPDVVPVGAEDEPLAELAGNVLKHYAKKGKLNDKDEDCFDHTVKSGRSLLYFYIDKENPFKPKIKCKRLPGYMFKLDSESIEADMDDARFLFIEKWLDEDEIEQFYQRDRNGRKIDPEVIKNHAGSISTNYPTFFNEANQKFRVVECWYRKWITLRWFINPLTGKEEGLELKEWNAYVKKLQEGIDLGKGLQTFEAPDYIDSLKRQMYYIVFVDEYELAGGKSPFRWEGFPAVLYCAYKDDDNNCWFSAIKAMKDPQIAVNTMRRQLTHLLQTLPKGLLAQEAGAILNIEEYEERSADPSFYLELAKGAIDKFKFVQQPAISPIFAQLISMNSQGMKDSSGVQDDLMGFQKTSREPGVSVRMRQEASIAVLYILFRNFKNSRLQSKKLLFSLVQQYITYPQLIRITGENGKQLVEINTQMNPQSEGFNAVSSGEFDLEVDETIENTTMRMTIAQILTEFSQNNPGSIPPDIILDYANMPFSVKTRVRQAWEAAQQLEQENLDADRAVEIIKATGVDRQPEKPDKKETKKEG